MVRILPEYTNTGALLISLYGSFELPQLKSLNILFVYSILKYIS